MIFPSINRQPSYRVEIPSMNGGINTHDAITAIGDNQMISGENVYFDKGYLSTRAGARVKWLEPITANSSEKNEVFLKSDITKNPISVRLIENEKYYVLVSVTNDTANTTIRAELIRDDFEKTIDILDKTIEGNVNPFLAQDGNYVYLFCGDSGIYELNTLSKVWTKLEENKANVDIKSPFYTPNVAYNAYTLANNKTECEYESALGEEINLLSSRYKMVYTMFNPDVATEEVTIGSNKYKAHKMWYGLAKPILSGSSIRINITYIKTDGSEGYGDHILTYNGANVVESEAAEDGLKLGIAEGGRSIYFTYTDGSEYITGDNISDGAKIYKNMLNQNMEIYAIFNNQNTEIQSMTFGEWYGSGSEGISGGSRLFLGGSTLNKSMIRYSAANNPLYFPENNYIKVGDTTTAVTGFGKQSNMLVIFKERETYYTYQADGMSYTAEDAETGRIQGTEVNAATFPIIQIHSEIGCDLPNTIALCSNKLCWMNKNGKVYTLTDSNQYSTSNIWEIGTNVERLLKAHSKEDMNRAFATSQGEYYYLSIGNKMYLLDIMSYSFARIANYSYSKNTEQYLVWYVWDICDNPVLFLPNTTNLLCQKSTEFTVVTDRFIFDETTGTEIPYTYTKDFITMYLRIFDEDRVEDEFIHPKFEQKKVGGKITVYEVEPEYSTAPITSRIETKIFNFGSEEKFKNIESVAIGVGIQEKTLVNLEYVTDRGVSAKKELHFTGNSGPYKPDFIQEVILYPRLNRVKRFGMKIYTNGKIAIDNLVIKYKTTGGVR